MKRILVFTLIVLTAGASAHDLITAELAEAYLDNLMIWQRQAQVGPDKTGKAEASLKIGETLDEIRGLLNRDLAVHGEVQGLASGYLVSELERIGTPLAYSESRNYFTVNSKYYRAVLDLGVSGRPARQAQLHLLRGEFYDSFGVDPLDANQTSAQLREQLVLVDVLMDSEVSEPDREELRFIATIVYARAATSASQQPAGSAYRGKALALAAAFEHDYPDSLRSAAMPVIRDALQAMPQTVAE